MAAPPILLVADDLSVIASVKRVLAREGYECVLASNTADAVIAFGHLLPGLMILQPSVEGDRGGLLLEELQQHPDAKLLRVLILGETVPGFACTAWWATSAGTWDRSPMGTAGCSRSAAGARSRGRRRSR